MGSTPLAEGQVKTLAPYLSSEFGVPSKGFVPPNTPGSVLRALEGTPCNEEVEICGPDPAHGSNPWRCKVWASWGKGLHFNNYLAVHGHWQRQIAPADIEIQVALLEVVGSHYKRVETAKTKYTYPGEGIGETGDDFSKGWVCESNHWYQAWVYGRTWDAWTKQTTWYATAEDGHWDLCPEGIDDPTEGPDQFVYK